MASSKQFPCYLRSFLMSPLRESSSLLTWNVVLWHHPWLLTFSLYSLSQDISPLLMESTNLEVRLLPQIHHPEANYSVGIFNPNSRCLKMLLHPLFQADSLFQNSLIFLSFNLLTWCITLIDLHILKNPCIPGINPTWSWCMSFLMCCWILFAKILLRIFASMFKNDGRNRTQINKKKILWKRRK